jgi:hypothetical protein
MTPSTGASRRLPSPATRARVPSAPHTKPPTSRDGTWVPSPDRGAIGSAASTSSPRPDTGAAQRQASTGSGDHCESEAVTSVRPQLRRGPAVPLRCCRWAAGGDLGQTVRVRRDHRPRERRAYHRPLAAVASRRQLSTTPAAEHCHRLSRRRSRVRVPSLPLHDLPANAGFRRTSRVATPSAGNRNGQPSNARREVTPQILPEVTRVSVDPPWASGAPAQK